MINEPEDYIGKVVRFYNVKRNNDSAFGVLAGFMDDGSFKDDKGVYWDMAIPLQDKHIYPSLESIEEDFSNWYNSNKEDNKLYYEYPKALSSEEVWGWLSKCHKRL